MRLEELAGRRVALLGLGMDVRAAVGAIIDSGPADVVVADMTLAPGSDIELSGHRLDVVSLEDACASSEVLVRSPGFPRYADPLVAARDRGVRMTTPLDLFVGGLAAGTRVVMVTGTKGKSTTTDLIGRFAQQSGIRVGVAGNLGIAVFDPGWDTTAPTIVLEVSSYQASDLHHAPDVAVVTSIAEDHLSWHGGLEAYLSDKLRIVENDGGIAGVVLVPVAEQRAREVLADRFPGLEPVLVDDIAPSAVEAQGSGVPAHRIRNAALAAAVVAHLGAGQLPVESVVAAARTSMPGRLDVCESPESVASITFVDDALASNPSATAAAIEWATANFSDVVVILGGDDRGVSIEPLRRALDASTRDDGRLLAAVTLPVNGADIAHRCGIASAGGASGVGEAVGIAVARIRDGGGPVGGRPIDRRPVVLFSPAAPTPAGSGNWKTRSDEFRAAIEALSHPTGGIDATPATATATAEDQIGTNR